ncbi:MAG: 3-oxoacyl-ACP synthase III family protein [Janthinobacterium lividum]
MSHTRHPALSVADVTLRGVVCALPQRRVDNDAFQERWGEKAVAEITAMTGVGARYWADVSQTAGDLCFDAAERLLTRLEWARDSVDALIFVTQTPDQRMPATSCTLHGRLGLANHCQAFDVGLGCSGYVYGVWLAAAMIAAGCTRVLLLAGDTSSRLIDPADRATALLFGDAGSASAFERSRSAAPTQFILGTDGTGAAHLAVAGGGFRPPADPAAANETLVMDGGAVFSFTLRAVPSLIRTMLDTAGRSVADVDFFALHQANRFMLRHIAKKLAIAPESMPINIDRYGNTSSASIPLLICTDLSERITTGPVNLLLAGFGVGFSWGAALLDAVELRCAELLAA